MSVPLRLWGVYARRVYQRECRRRRIYDQRAFEDAVAADGMRRLSVVAERWWAMFVVDERRLAECLIDGTAPRYATRRNG